MCRNFPSYVWGSLSSSFFFFIKNGWNFLDRSYIGSKEAESLETQTLLWLLQQTAQYWAYSEAYSDSSPQITLGSLWLNVCSWHISARGAQSNKVSFLRELPCNVTQMIVPRWYA